MGTRKEAVDATTKAYWSTFFKGSGYGEALTKDVPRRVAMAVAAQSQAKYRSAHVVPSGHAKRSTGGFILEGFFRGNKADGSGVDHKAFCSEFDAQGTLVSMKVI